MKIADDVTFRRAGDGDWPRLAALSVLCYPAGGDSAASRVERYRYSASAFAAERFLVERGGRHLGQYGTLPFTGWLGGVATPVGGLAGVAVAPDARRSGVAGAIVRHHLASLRESGTPWAMLYPFAASFYAAFGWAPSASLARWRFAPGDLPSFSERSSVERLDPRDAATAAAIHRCYLRHCTRTNGSLSRPADLLGTQWRSEREIVVGVRRSGEVAGYLVASLRAPTPRPQTLACPELVADDDGAWRALFGFLAAQADQVEAIELDLPVAEPLGALLARGVPTYEDLDAPGEHQVAATLWSGAMARVVDLRRALVGRGYSAETSARVAFAAHDPHLPGNGETLTLTVEQGAATVETGRASGAPLVAGPIGAVTQLLTGALGLAAAARAGLVAVEGGGERERAAIERLLALPVPFSLVAF